MLPALKAAALRDRLAACMPDLAVADYRAGDRTVRVSRPGGVVISCAFEAPTTVETMLFYNGRIDQGSQRHHATFGSLVYYFRRGYSDGPLATETDAPSGPVDYEP
jgi:hypothetical protein